MVLTTSSISGASANDSRCKLHAPGLDLRQVEDVVDQGEQVPARAEHAVERLDVLLQRLRILPQHLGDADDGVERRAQLVAHVGEELRLVLTRLGKLPALVLDFVEQPHILDGDSGLVSERGDQLDLLVGKGANCTTYQRNDSDWSSFPQQWNAEHGTIALARSKMLELRRVFIVFANIGDMNDLRLQQGSRNARVSAGLNGKISQVLIVCRSGPIRCSHMKGRTLGPPDRN